MTLGMVHAAYFPDTSAAPVEKTPLDWTTFECSVQDAIATIETNHECTEANALFLSNIPIPLSVCLRESLRAVRREVSSRSPFGMNITSHFRAPVECTDSCIDSQIEFQNGKKITVRVYNRDEFKVPDNGRFTEGESGIRFCVSLVEAGNEEGNTTETQEKALITIFVRESDNKVKVTFPTEVSAL